MEEIRCSKCNRPLLYLESYFTKDEEKLCDDCAWNMSTEEVLEFFGIEKILVD